MCWLNEKLARSCGEAELLSWTTMMGGFAGGIGRGRQERVERGQPVGPTQPRRGGDGVIDPVAGDEAPPGGLHDA